jgi:hypothetical protein
MAKSVEFTVNEARGTVLVKITVTDTWGRVRQRTQHTFSRRHFEAALRRAEMVVPWEKVETIDRRFPMEGEVR